MLKDTLEALKSGRVGRRTVLKGMLVGLGAGVLVQASGGVMAAMDDKQPPGKVEKKKIEKNKTEKGKESKGKGSKGKGNEKRKAEEPKAQ